MNIFVLDKDPWKCAKHHCDIHVNKMFMESCQMLATVIQLKLGDQEDLPKQTHIHHPCVKWVMESKGNFDWLRELAVALSVEFSKRRNKTHKWVDVLDYIYQYALEFDKQELTPWVQVMPDEFATFNNSIKAYRRYYAAKLWDFRKRGLIKRKLK